MITDDDDTMDHPVSALVGARACHICDNTRSRKHVRVVGGHYSGQLGFPSGIPASPNDRKSVHNLKSFSKN
ncbi:hypothetical protein DPMN_152903 [Dreissena polymorpha]|uniref:Uncharacterized protein n=1 Tax=Dreissena polymorpha TaxID=45954 RepID=A0A9D4J8T7_DREPO|nr:hypothetical protein DPMN_152903 [Dreissena polymorpha]